MSLFGSEHARHLHAKHPAIDLHADSLMWSRWVGYDLAARHSPMLPLAAIGGHVDLPRLREGGIGAQFFGLVSLPLGKTKGPKATIDEQIDELERVARNHPHRVEIVRTADAVATVDAAEKT